MELCAVHVAFRSNRSFLKVLPDAASRTRVSDYYETVRFAFGKNIFPACLMVRRESGKLASGHDECDWSQRVGLAVGNAF